MEKQKNVFYLGSFIAEEHNENTIKKFNCIYQTTNQITKVVAWFCYSKSDSN